MTFLSPFEHEFMLTAFGIAILVATVCAVFSCFLILKGWSLMGDAISHAVLPGIVVAYLIGIPLSVGAFFAGILCAVGSGYIRNNSRLKEDTVMGVVFTGLFALGLVMFSKIDSDQHLNHILFGNLLGISAEQIIQTLIIGSFTLLATLLLRKDLLLFCFDPAHAQAVGLNTRLFHYLFLSLLAMTIVTALQATGIILVISMLITPGSVGFLMTDKFHRMMLISVVTAVFSSFLGTYGSFFLDASSAACIVLVQSLAFVAAFLFAPKRGVLIRYFNLKNTPDIRQEESNV